MKTVLEGTKISAIQQQSITASFNSSAFNVVGSSNLAICLMLGAFSFTTTNKLTISLTECDTSGGSYTAVANSGSDVRVIIGRTGGSDVYRDGTGGYLSSVVIDGEADANGAGTSVGSDVYMLEYLGDKPYVKLTVVEAGTVVCDGAVFAVQTGLRKLPNISNIG
jgi:hypothetical protein